MRDYGKPGFLDGWYYSERKHCNCGRDCKICVEDWFDK